MDIVRSFLLNHDASRTRAIASMTLVHLSTVAPVFELEIVARYRSSTVELVFLTRLVKTYFTWVSSTVERLFFSRNTPNFCWGGRNVPIFGRGGRNMKWAPRPGSLLKVNLILSRFLYNPCRDQKQSEGILPFNYWWQMFPICGTNLLHFLMDVSYGRRKKFSRGFYLDYSEEGARKLGEG